MEEQTNLEPKKIPEYLVSEYERIGISVSNNYGLSSPAIVNVLTGVMHSMCEYNGVFGKSCECPANLKPQEVSKCGLEYVEFQRNTRFKLSISTDCAVLNSMSHIAFRACRKCEKIANDSACTTAVQPHENNR